MNCTVEGGTHVNCTVDPLPLVPLGWYSCELHSGAFAHGSLIQGGTHVNCTVDPLPVVPLYRVVPCELHSGAFARGSLIQGAQHEVDH